MTTIHETFTEAHSRPSDTPWTPEENARYAANRADAIRRANERAAAKRNGTFTLINDIWTARFEVFGDKATITHIRGRGFYAREEKPMVMNREQARRHWMKLIEAGYTKF